MPDQPSQTVRLAVRRQDGGGEPYRWVVDVPVEPGMTLLDALRWARANVDPTLAFDFSCITNNSCRLCQARIDGKVGYLCTVAATDPDYELDPVDASKVVKDLVMERNPVW